MTRTLQSQLHPLQKFLLNTYPRFGVTCVRTSLLLDLIYTLCYDSWHGAEIQKATPKAHYAGSAC